MGRIRRIAASLTPVTLLLALLSVALMPIPAGASHHVEWVVHYEPFVEAPEGIAVDKVGNIFVGMDVPGQVRAVLGPTQNLVLGRATGAPAA